MACDWQVRGPHGFELLSTHFYPERKDEHAEPFYEMVENQTLSVQELMLLADGSLHILFNDGYDLQVQPSEDVTITHWMFLAPEESDIKTLMMDVEELVVFRGLT